MRFPNNMEFLEQTSSYLLLREYSPFCSKRAGWLKEEIVF
jgi:hypothetical protein